MDFLLLEYNYVVLFFIVYIYNNIVIVFEILIILYFYCKSLWMIGCNCKVHGCVYYDTWHFYFLLKNSEELEWG